MTEIIVVNASRVLHDDEVARVIPALQRWDSEMLQPAWGFDPCTYIFMPFHEWAHEVNAGNRPAGWPIFLNRHSTDVGVGGFHDDESGNIFGRIFVGDALRYGISWTVDLSHEAAEMRGDPTIDKIATLADGQVALVELCDPVEDDALAIDVDGIKLSDFVLPSYFSGAAGPWDFQNALSGPCPMLTTGGYQSLFVNGEWTQVTAMYLGGMPSHRSMRYHHARRRPAPLPQQVA